MAWKLYANNVDNPEEMDKLLLVKTYNLPRLNQREIELNKTNNWSETELIIKNSQEKSMTQDSYRRILPNIERVNTNIHKLFQKMETKML